MIFKVIIPLLLPLNLLIGEYAYITNNYTATITVIDIPDNTFVTNFPVPFSLELLYGISISPNKETAYILSHQGLISDNDTLDILQLSNNSFVAKIPGAGFLSNLPYFSSITPNGEQLWITNSGNNTISILNAIDYSLITVIIPGDSLNQPTGIAFLNENFAWINNTANNTISIIQTSDYSIVDTINPSASLNSPAGIAFTPDGLYAWITNLGNNSITIIRTSDNTLVTTLTDGLGLFNPAGIAFSSSSKYAYIANNLVDVNTISMIDTNNYTLVSTLTGDVFQLDGPFGIAIGNSPSEPEKFFKRPYNHRLQKQ